MHRRVREVETLLREWCGSDYGSLWLKQAQSENGLIRVKPRQMIPVVHLISLGDRPMFIAPQKPVRVGHRMVGPNQFESGQPLSENELALGPEIQIDVVEDPVLLTAAARLDFSLQQPGVKKPSQVFSTPAHYLLAPTAWPKKAFVLYQHIFGEGGSYPNDGYFYVGVSTRSWQTRWAEHRRAMERGSALKFHRRLREEMAAGRVTYITHKVMAITQDLEALYATEEWLVQGHWDDTRRLNMIPGGKSGLRYLREHGMLSERTVPSPDERDQLVVRWIVDHPRKGLPAPWLAAKWQDNEWAAAQICSRDDRLSADQVSAIRRLAETYSAEVIKARIGARSVDQVQGVIDGSTYVRVP